MAVINLTEEQSKQIEKIFKGLYEVESDIKDLQISSREMKKSLAESLQVKSKIISKAYSQWKLQIEENDVAQSVNDILEHIKS